MSKFLIPSRQTWELTKITTWDSDHMQIGCTPTPATIVVQWQPWRPVKLYRYQSLLLNHFLTWSKTSASSTFLWQEKKRNPVFLYYLLTIFDCDLHRVSYVSFHPDCDLHRVSMFLSILTATRIKSFSYSFLRTHFSSMVVGICRS